jgi:hypothetical protein
VRGRTSKPGRRRGCHCLGPLARPWILGSQGRRATCPPKGRTLSVSNWPVVLCSHPLLCHRHMARPAQREYDCHHVHPGFPVLLPACGLCWRHRPQLCVSACQLEGLDPRDTRDTGRDSASGSLRQSWGGSRSRLSPWEPLDFKVLSFSLGGRGSGKRGSAPALSRWPFQSSALDRVMAQWRGICVA